MNLLVALITSFVSFTAISADNPYQLGPSWSKQPVTSDTINKVPEKLKQNAFIVAQFLGGTSFYLGKHNNKHLMATNFHVLPSPLNCYSLNRARFSILKESFSCKEFIVGVKETDLTIFEIDVPQNKEKLLASFTLAHSITTSGPLFSYGHGGWKNPKRSLLFTHDEFCKSFSSAPNLIHDPDTVNPVNYAVWSIPIGCDFSHGDSGSPVFNKDGHFVGIFWTGNAPKPSYLKERRYMEELYKERDERIWSELSYMSPLQKIVEALKKRAHNGHPQKSTISALVMFFEHSN